MRVQQSSAELPCRNSAPALKQWMLRSPKVKNALQRHTECEELNAMLHDTAAAIQNAENTVQGMKCVQQRRKTRREAVKAEADRQMLDAKEKESAAPHR